MEKAELSTRPFGPIYDKIGPIVDPAFLKILGDEQIKNIVVTIVKAEHAAVMAQAKALEEVVKIAEAARPGR